VFVSLGLGSIVASTIDAAPWLIAVSRRKAAIFAAVGIMLAVNYWLAIVRPQRMDCAPGDVCHVDSPVMRASRVMFWTSVAIWAAAVVFTYAALLWVRIQ
jgi:mercuric ion transport protein